MWVIYEHKRVSKNLNAAPLEIQKRYEKWKDIVSLSGPQGLREFKGLHDESLSGKWKGYRSSRLSIHYRVIYKIEKDKIVVRVERVAPHDYSRK